jgi:exodeoxyribonuclease VII large subunit
MKPVDGVKIFSVSEVSARINGILKDTFASIWVEGEISNYKKHPASGHSYLTLKDDKSQLSAIMFNHVGQKVKFEIEDGQKVLCFGSIGVYQPQGKYQIYIESIEPQGLGALQLAFDQLKAKLEKEGLFDEKYKRPIPILPRKIGIVTSSSGAAIKDILHNIYKRFSRAHLLINPVRVQGKGAAEEIAQAIKEFNTLDDIDVLIVGRGGGGLEDLWAFNEEIVARAIFSSKIPIISAVGHEKDYLISDFVSDLRAATPTKAAEVVIISEREFNSTLINYSKSMQAAFRSSLNNLEKYLLKLSQSRFFRDPEEFVNQRKQQLDETLISLSRSFKHFLMMKQERLKRYSNLITAKRPEVILRGYQRRVFDLYRIFERSIIQYIDNKGRDLSAVTSQIEALSPLAVLTRGYGISFDKNNKIIKSTKDVKEDDEIETRLKDGHLRSVVKKINSEISN